jgi:hypothetical protein
MFDEGLAALIGVIVGGAIGVAGAVLSQRTYKLELAKTIDAVLRPIDPFATARIEAYSRLWPIVGAISTRQSLQAIVDDLPRVQRELHAWYHSGSGLFLSGSPKDGLASKSAFFALRDLDSTNPVAIWVAAHQLRVAVRRDLGIFESDEDEREVLRRAKARLQHQ